MMLMSEMDENAIGTAQVRGAGQSVGDRDWEKEDQKHCLEMIMEQFKRNILGANFSMIFFFNIYQFLN